MKADMMLTVTGIAPLAYIALAGDVDGTDAAKICSVANELVNVGVRDVTVDLGRVTWMGAEGLGALAEMGELFGAATVTMALVGATAATRAIFEIDRLNRAYYIVPPHLGRRAGCVSDPGRVLRPKWRRWPLTRLGHASPGKVPAKNGSGPELRLGVETRAARHREQKTVVRVVAVSLAERLLAHLATDDLDDDALRVVTARAVVHSCTALSHSVSIRLMLSEIRTSSALNVCGTAHLVSIATWEAANSRQWVLFSDTGAILGSVNMDGPYAWADWVTYRASGPVLDQVTSFNTLGEARRAVEDLARGSVEPGLPS